LLILLASRPALALTVGGEITTDTTWTLSDSPLLVTSNLTVTGARLNIAPGVIVKFSPSVNFFFSNAVLNAQATVGQPIHFTSINDNSVGGATGSGSPATGDWATIYFNTSSATLGNVHVRYGGSQSFGSAMIYTYASSTVTFTGGEASFSQTDAVFGDNSSCLSISGTAFTSNEGWAVNTDGTIPLLSNSTISSGAKGVRISRDQGVQFHGNSFQNLTTLAMELNAGVRLLGAQDTEVSPLLSRPMRVEIPSGFVAESTEWVLADRMTYVVLSDVTFSAGAMLTVPPGAIIKMSAASNNLFLQGGLTALGGPTTPIYFTSLKDDLVGGDTNGDGGFTSPAPGDWATVYVFNSSATLTNAHFRYGGNQSFTSAMLYAFAGGAVTLLGSEASYSQTDAIAADNSAFLSVSGTVFTGNGGWALNTDGNIPFLLGSTIASGAKGVRISRDQGVQFHGNALQNLSVLAMELSAGVRLLGAEDTVVAPLLSRPMHVNIPSGLVTESTEWVLADLMPYVVLSDLTFSAGAMLTVPPAGIIKLSAASNNLFLQGGLTALGGPATPIYFTSLKDDAVGGDTNGDGNATLPTPGDWSTVYFVNSSATVTNTHFRYGGNQSFTSAMIYAYSNSVVTLMGGEASYSQTAAIQTQDTSTLLISSAVISSNQIGVNSFSSLPPILHGCLIFGNSNFGVQNDNSSSILQAQFNWWGSSMGPTNVSNPGGAGDAVSDYVDFIPFLQSSVQLAPPLVVSVNLLDPSPTTSKLVRVQVQFTNPMKTQIQPTATCGRAPPYNTFAVSSGVFLSPTVWLATATIPANAPDGAYFMVISSAQDTNGQILAPSTAPFYTVDNTPPAVAISSPVAGALVSRPFTAIAAASDVGGIASVVFSVDGVVLATATAEPYSFFWDTRNFPDGSHVLAASAIDAAGNFSSAAVTVLLNYAPPNAPVIASPREGFAVASASINVIGTAEPGTTVQLQVNGLDLATAATSGVWAFLPAILPAEGDITLTAIAFEPRGFSAPSNPVHGVFTTSAPNPPTLPSVSALADGNIHLSWSAPDAGKTPSSYRVYRSTDDAALTAGNPAPNSSLRVADGLSQLFFEEIPLVDDLYFYAITSVDVAGNESGPSEVVYVVTDSRAPTAAVIFSALPPIGVGDYQATFTISEALSQPPLFTFTPPDGQPIALNLTGVTATLWRATVTVTSSMGVGTAQFAFQGTDLSGNVGLVLSSSTIQIDAAGPLGSVALSKTSPLGVGALALTLTLDEAATTIPSLSVVPEGRPSLSVPLTAQGLSGRIWTGAVAITSTTGDGQATFTYSATDQLGNTNTQLSGGTTSFVIDTVAPGQPLVVRANAQAGGSVIVTWSAPLGERPALYRVYRDGVAISTVAPATDGSGSFTETPIEGQHQHEVSSLDLAGNESALSDPISVADATPPPPPVNVTVAFNAFNQIQLNWLAASTDTVSFRLYRSTSPITSLTGLQGRNAVAPFIDSPDQDANYRYVVTALDQVGNESGVSNQVSIVFDKAAPVVTFNGITDGGFFNGNVFPAFNVADGNLDASSVRARLDGLTFVAGSTVSAEGVHVLTVTASDVEAHYSTTTATFTIDKTAPQISFSVEQGAALVSTTSVSVNVLIADLNPGASSFLLTNQLLGTSAPYNSGDPIDRNGGYILSASAQDLAGNVSSATLSFHLQSAPIAPMDLAVTVQGSARLSWTKPEPGVVAYRVYRDASRISSSLHPNAFFEDVGFTAGAHVYEVSAVDAAGVEGSKAKATVPAAVLILAPVTLTRGFFDALHPTVKNNTGSTLNAGPAVLTLTNASGMVVAQATAAAVSMAAGQTGTFEGVIATPAGLSAASSLHAVVSLPTDAGSSVFLAGDFALSAAEPALPILEVFPDALVPGTLSSSRVRLYNRGSAPMDVITAKIVNSTSAPVDDVRVQLKTPEGTLFASAGLMQTGNGANAALVDGVQVFFVTVPAGSSFLFDPVRALVPNTAVQSMSVAASVSTPTFNLPLMQLAGTRGFSSSASQAIVAQVPYTATVFSDSSLYDQGSSVTLNGQALDSIGGLPVPNADVVVHVVSNGFDRHVTAVTDNTGSYRAGFFPLPNEAGLYTISASHPDVVTHGAQSVFTIVGLSYQFSDFTATLAQNSTYTFRVSLTNSGGAPITGLASSSRAVSGSGLTLTLDPSTLPATLAAGEQAQLAITLNVAPLSSSGTINVTVRESHGFTRVLPVQVTVVPAQVIPSVTPSAISIGMLGGEVKTVSLVLENKGFDVWRGITLNAPSLSWVTLQGPTNIGDLAPGGNVSVSLQFAPPSSLPNQTYAAEPLLQITSLNAPAVAVRAGVAVTSTRVGDLLVSVINADLPKSAGGQGVPISSAKVNLVSLDVTGLSFTLSADQNGLAAFSQIPSGNYSWNVTAQGFQTRAGTVLVQPGMTNSLLALLTTAVVSYQWTAVPTTIKDKYDIVLSLTYRTDVLVPVLVVDPPQSTYDLNMGQSAFGQYTITNKGLVSVFDFNISRSLDDGLDVELPFTNIPEIKAGQSVVVPYKVTFVHASSCDKQGILPGVGQMPCAFDGSAVATAGANHSIRMNGTGAAAGCSGGGPGDSQGSGGTGSLGGSGIFPGEPHTPPAQPLMCSANGSGSGSWIEPPCANIGAATINDNCSAAGPGKASPSLTISPAYRSDGSLAGPLGVGWHADYFESITIATSTYVVHDGHGAGIGFALQDPGTLNSQLAVCTSFTPVFSPPPGSHDQLTSGTPATVCGALSALPPPASLDYKRKDGTSIHFVLTGGLYLPSQLTDRNGNKVIYTRDASQRLTQLTDVHGRTVGFGYDAQGRVTSITDNAGRIFHCAYNSAGDKIADNDVNGDITHYAYDALHRITQITYPNGGIKTYTYDSSGRLLTESDDQGNNLLTYSYSSGSGDPGLFGATSFTTATLSGMISVTDALGHVSQYEWKDFNGWQRTTKIFDSVGGVTKFTYDADATLVSQTDPLGRVTRLTHDNNGNINSVVDAAGGTVQATYNANFSQLTSVIDPKANTSALIRDGVGNLVQTQDAGNNFTSMQYDGQGHMTTLRDALGNTVGIGYNGNGAPISAADPLGRTVTMGRDALSRMTSLTDPLGNQTLYSYAADGKPTQIRDALNNVTSIVYEPGRGLRRPLSITDAKNHATGFHYDSIGRMTGISNALGQSDSIIYDATSRPTRVTTRNGQNINLGYDDMDRLSSIGMPEGNTALSYDLAGNLLSASHYNGSAMTMGYDGLNRMNSIGQTLPNGFTANIGYTYDANGNRTSMTTPWGTFNYAYDALDRVVSIGNPFGQTVTFTYDALSRRTSMTYPNGTKTTYAYDAAGQVKQIVHRKTSNQAAIAFDNYVYDANGNSTSITDMVGTRSFTYDRLNRLTSANHPGATSLPLQAETFSYDGVGNRTADALRSGYNYDAANRMVSDSSFTYTSDANGNRASRTSRASGQTTTFIYNSLNQMIETDEPSGVVATYKYDAAGRRIEKKASSTITRYIYDGANIVAILDGNNNLLLLLTQGPGVDVPMIGRINGADYFFHQDVLQSVVALTDINGTIVETVEYQAYGKAVIRDQNGVLYSSSTVGNPFLYTGRELDQETRLYFYRARYYGPETGRFLQEDPITSTNQYVYADSVGKPQVNAYQYAFNNPLMYTDPYGTFPLGRFFYEFYFNYWRQFASGGADFVRNYRNMRDANTIGADKYFHCMANCQSTKEGPGGADAAIIIGEGRELTDQYLKGDSRQACDEDRAANRTGQNGAKTGSCQSTCNVYRVPGLDPRY
jgi:RHS repeat-associated protein